MATPYYNDKILPCILLPFVNTHGASKRYLGGQALTGNVSASINIMCQTNQEMNDVHTFWRVDCNYGLETFIINIPLFGFDTSNVDFLVQFVGDFEPTKSSAALWEIQFDLRVISPIFLVRDDAGDPITDDNGGYIYADESLHPSTDNIITYTPTTEIVV